MKLPAVFDRIIHKTPPQVERFLSLVLEKRYVQAAVWHPDESGIPLVEQIQTERMEDESWESRTDAADQALTKLDTDETLGNVEKVVLGLPQLYINSTGDVDASVRTDIKKLCKELRLKPIGFVALHSALIYKLRKDEGVPPTVILLSISDGTVTVSLYKIGVLAGCATISTDTFISDLENVFKNWKDIEVLPSRMLLYGTDQNMLEEMKHDLLKHPWPTRVAFIHFPKIDILPISQAAEAVSLAGYSEMSSDLTDEYKEDGDVTSAGVQPEMEREEYELVKNKDDETSFYAQQEDHAELQTTSGESSELSPKESRGYQVVVEETEESEAMSNVSMDEESKGKEQEESYSPDHANLVMVEPETLGFRKGVDVLAEAGRPIDKNQNMNLHGVNIEKSEDEIKDGVDGAKIDRKLKKVISFPKFSIVRISFDRFRPWINNISLTRGIVPIVFIFILFFLLFIGYNWFIPKASITIITSPRTLKEILTITIDPHATIVDKNANTIPGKTQEQIVSGEKTLPVTSKKDKGTPAKGMVTIYNKSISEKTFRSGTVLLAKGMSFTLDADSKVASASESFTQRVYGKTNASVTAVQIGPEGNLPSDSEFNFKDLSTEIAVARNDQPFTLGTSKEVTVVTRSDYDALVKSLTSDLVEKAKTELATSVGGHEKLIDSTISSSVTEKTFQEELDQEASELHGTLTIKVSGISYKESDVTELFHNAVQSKIPSGYALVSEQSTSSMRDINLKKDGTISVTSEIKGIAIPTLDLQTIAKNLSGKSINQASEYLKSQTGVVGMEASNRWGMISSMLPWNKRNISVSISLQE